ncbi:alkaline phosphatase family protein [Halococcus sp. IIIV-5B]|uniref:alkaline phosphatase family protein n=1 Tax=Halococcus sp. IIIV-5B TaxID=2321230 RepID=UPI001314B0B2|nr:alkaline phosphatase family protein [Halococcus sp. IIIV-5B]
MSPVTIIGLDGAPWKLLGPLLDDGELPNISRLITSGFSGSLYSTVPSRTSPAIPSLYTGCDPSELGFIGFTKSNGKTISSNDIDLPRIWTILDHHDVRSSVANVRTTYPPDRTSGVVIAGDPAPGEDSDYAHPPEIREQIKGFRAEDLDHRRHEELVPASDYADEVTDISIEILNRRFRSFMEILATEDSQFNMFWIGGTDFLQHRLWGHSEQLKRFYKAADRCIGQVLEATDGDLFVLSDHGFSTPSEWKFHLNQWLHQEGYVKLYGGAVGSRAIRVGQTLARKYVPTKYLLQVLNYRNGTSDEDPDPPWFDSSYLNTPGVKPSSTAQLGSPSTIHINASGRKRCQIASEIISKLESVRTPTGDAAIENAWLGEELYSDGRYSEDLPDIFIQASDSIGIDPQITSSSFSKNSTQRTGHVHAREGVWLGAGPNVESQSEAYDATITDVAPTVLHMLDVPVGEHMHGSVQQDLLTNDAPIRTENYQRSVKRGVQSKEDQAEMEEWLSNMGYL